MRRILLVLVGGLVMAAIVVASALPAFARVNCVPPDDVATRCWGGNSARDAGFTGGGGGNYQQYPDENKLVISGGGATKEFGSGGGRCTIIFGEPDTPCTGKQ
jgi:hypothetical protein